MVDVLGPFAQAMKAPIPAEVLLNARGLVNRITPPPHYNPDNQDPPISRIYFHWTVQAQGCVDAAYNYVITKENGAYEIKLSTSTILNYRRYDQHGDVLDLPDGYAEHTYHRNTGAVGIALDGMDGTGVGPYKFGDDPVTTLGILHMCGAIAACAKVFDIDIGGMSLTSDPFYGEINVMSHSEAAHLPGAPPAYQPYWWGDSPDDGDTRGDFNSLIALSEGTPLDWANQAVVVGNAIRLVAHNIKAQL